LSFAAVGTSRSERVFIGPSSVKHQRKRRVKPGPAGEVVPWTKPADPPYDPTGPLPPLGGVFDGVNLVTADGPVRFVRPGVSEATWRNAITRDDSRRLDPDW
jgi:hypothetical protein